MAQVSAKALAWEIWLKYLPKCWHAIGLNFVKNATNHLKCLSRNTWPKCTFRFVRFRLYGGTAYSFKLLIESFYGLPFRTQWKICKNGNSTKINSKTNVHLGSQGKHASMVDG